jgi:hypothetical protein
MKFFIVFSVAMLCQSASGFSFTEMEHKRQTLQMSAMTEGDSDSRRDFFAKTGVAAISAASSGLGWGVLAPAPANAIGGVDKVNAKLKG